MAICNECRAASNPFTRYPNTSQFHLCMLALLSLHLPKKLIKLFFINDIIKNYLNNLKRLCSNKKEYVAQEYQFFVIIYPTKLRRSNEL